MIINENGYYGLITKMLNEETWQFKPVSKEYKNRRKEISNELYNGVYDDEEKNFLTTRWGKEVKQVEVKPDKQGRQRGYWDTKLNKFVPDQRSVVKTNVPYKTQKLSQKEMTKADGSKYSDDEFKTYDVPLNLTDKNLFTVGNEKLPDDTLIVNLTSALECPSAKYCAIIASCYAKNGERRSVGAQTANLYKQNAWKLAEKRGKLGMLFELIKLGIYDIDTVQGHRINYIRVDESGDFFSPNLVKAWDDFAGEIENGFTIPNIGSVNHGIIVATYTAQRGEEFQEAWANIKHMIVNASLPNIVVGDETRIKRNFFGVSEELLNQLPDTTISQIDGENVPVLKFAKKEVTGLPTVSGYYYKCPCGNLDEVGGKIQCSRCRVCYSNKPGIYNNGTVGAYKILVAAHGATKDHFKDSAADAKRQSCITNENKNCKKLVISESLFQSLINKINK